MDSDPIIGFAHPAATGGWIDLHAHLLPGVDDGPETIEEAAALCRLLARDGVVTAVATPHQLGRYEGTNSAAEIRSAVAALRAQLERFHVKLDVRAGAEVRLDPRIPVLIEHDQILTLGDTRKYLLLELPSGLAFEVDSVLPRVGVAGLRIVLAHVERYDFLRNPDIARRWREAGALLQVNSSSLVGGWGDAAQQGGWDLLEADVVDLIAGDAHSVGQRRARWTQATGEIARRYGPARVQALCIDNPRKILQGEPLP